jgi:N-acetylglucosamine repressor
MKKLSINNAVNSSQQSHINLSLIFNYIRNSGSVNRSRIAKDLGLSIPAVSRSVETLGESGLIINKRNSHGTARKGTPVYKVNPQFGFVLAIDLFSIQSEAAVVDFSGQIKFRKKGFKPEESGDVIRDLNHLIDKCISEFMIISNVTKDKIKAIGLGVPAIVDRNSGKLLLSYYEDYEYVDFKNVLENRTGVPVNIENICSLSALGEKMYGEKHSDETLVLIEIGAGIGSGILLDGNVYRGNGFAGEIGFSLTESDDVAFLGRKIGHLEKRASLLALNGNILHELSCGVVSTLTPLYQSDPSTIIPSMIFEHAMNGDNLCLMAISAMVRHISTALHNMAIIINPGSIIISGDVCSMPGITKLLLNPIIENLTMTLPFAPPKITMSSLGSESGLLGAAIMAIDSILLKEYPYHYNVLGK